LPSSNFAASTSNIANNGNFIPLEIIVEKVRIKKSLNGTRDPYNILVVMWLMKVAVDPIHQIESSIRTQQKNIVRSEVFNLTVTREDDNLRKNDNSLQVDGKSP
jgi:hypothetical protein